MKKGHIPNIFNTRHDFVCSDDIFFPGISINADTSWDFSSQLNWADSHELSQIFQSMITIICAVVKKKAYLWTFLKIKDYKIFNVY